jgi:hypothetical protein
MSQKNILAYCQSPEQAEGIANKLKALRVVDVQVENFSLYPEAGSSRLSSIDEDILLEAAPSENGMSDAEDNNMIRTNIVLTAIVDESIYEQALRVIHEGGGSV